MVKSTIKKLENFSTKQLNDKQKYYLLLDGGLNKNLFDEISKIEFKIKKVWIYEDTELDEDKEFGPLLIELDNANKHLEYFINHWSQQHLGIVIGTQATLEELIQHLTNLRYVEIPDRDPKHKVLFRWYEPRQLFGLLNSFDKKETVYFMGPMDSISWCEWAHDEGIWYSQEKSEMKENITFVSPLGLQQKTLDALAEQDENYFVREVTRELINEYPKLLEKGDENTLKKSIKKQTKKAISQNIDRRNDIKEFIYTNLNQN